MPLADPDLARLCLHTITTRPWQVEDALQRYAAAGIRGVTIWRDALEGRSPQAIGELARHAGLSVVSLCRAGFLAQADRASRLAALEDNRRALHQAALLGTDLLVLVCGADPRQPLATSRKQIQDGIEVLMPEAEACGVRLAVEPLHPMYADTRSAIITLKQANDLCQALHSPWLGVVVDVYHLWWDPQLEHEIRRCGQNGWLFAFHVSDWLSPTTDLLEDRGIMGEGCIPIRKIRAWAEKAGFDGFIEVEIFSRRYWGLDQQVYLDQILRAYQQNV